MSTPHHRPRCRKTGKLRFSSELAAHCAAMALRKPGDVMQAYRCPHCGWWHMGHKRKRA